MTTFRYVVNGETVSEEQFTEHMKRKRKSLGLGDGGGAPIVASDRGDWRREQDRKTGRNGRYAPQLARYPGDPTAVFPTKTAMLEEAKRRGMWEDKD